MEKPPKSEAPRYLVDKYKEQAEALLKQHGKDFDRFTENLEHLIEKGDSLLLNEKVTAYNILLSKEDMDLANEDRLMFYSNYIGKPEHFSELIAEMVDEGVITEDQVRLGKKASKTRFTGKWKPDPEHEKLDWVEGKDETGKIQKKRVSKTVETVVIFTPDPDSDRQAKRIAEKLYKKLDWAFPDIRATVSLKDALSELKFEEVIANILVLNTAQMVALHELESFRKPYFHEPILANQHLLTFMAIAKSSSG